ncbi:sulfatase-like hydrolase/transferase [Tautonia rosea]|uniref:sulfatase-like hydrolase/transferase n=1 Tax=Tautonia rosea TaxID=2728037 RepID=UPI00147517C7|nr:sulfatase-like hydrolase/transferase [Tautonia rosea]
MISNFSVIPIAFFSAVFLQGTFASAQEAADAHRPPNILLILIDDLGYADVGCFGNRSNQTPHIDRLAAEGLRFTDFHSNGPMCSATRAALLTGRYQNRFGRAFEGALDADRDHDIGLPLEELTIAEALKPAGYVSGLFGKWHLGYQAPFLPTRQGFDEFRGLLTGDGDHHSHLSRSGDPDWWVGETLALEPGYSVDLITRDSIDFIERHRDQPFFLLVSHLAIHFPWQGPNEPAHRQQGHDYSDLSKLGPHPPGAVRPVVREMVEAIDRSVGQLITTLQRLNLDRSTLVIFTSDNGGYRHYGNRFHGEISDNGPLRGQKGQLFEGGHRVPAIAWWPGRVAPGVTPETAMTMDLLPTFLDLAHLEPIAAPALDGISLAPLLLRREPLPDRPFFWRNGSVAAARLGPWKLLIDDGRPLLFHLAADPSESHNLSATNPNRVAHLSSMLDTWQDEMDRPRPLPANPSPAGP